MLKPSEEEPYFRRLPQAVADATNAGVGRLSHCPAGGRVRFSTDSRFIAIRVSMPGVTRFYHMPLSGTAGLDLYIDKTEDDVLDPAVEDLGFYRVFVTPYDMQDGYEARIDLGTKKMRYRTINLPSYSNVKDLYIGIDEDSTLNGGLRYLPILPVVYYGSSITQGACSSRPGNIYQNIIARRLNIDYINLGFSGSARGEKTIRDYMATLSMSAFVSDYDHNAPSPEYLEETHFELYKTIRENHPNIPYIMITRPDYRNGDRTAQRRQVVIDSYEKAKVLGDKNVYFIDGKDFFTGRFNDMCTVDACHPTDLGFAFMADAIGDMLQKVLNLK
ncbi:MAG: hypothetical protein IKU19_03700 [Clostridia bacterium]|nr:hypothetical protein [Clostridia bacterium]